MPVRLGFYPKDLFILLAKSRLVADWQKNSQKNARKYHSYFWVFEKSVKAEPVTGCLAGAELPRGGGNLRD